MINVFGGGDKALERASTLIGALWIVLVFVAFATVGASHGFVIVREAGPAISAHTNWLPLAAEVSRGNLFPIDPSLGTGASALSFYPYITLWVHGAFSALFGAAGAERVGGVIWPMICFLLLLQTYRIYLPRRWSFTLAALGLVMFAAFPLRNFVLGLAQGEGWRQLGVAAAPDVASFPIPAFTLAAFLFCFVLSEQRRALSNRRLTVVTILWALQTLIHPVNALMGLLYWFSRFPLLLFRQRHALSLRQIAVITLGQAALALLVALPAIVGWFAGHGLQSVLGAQEMPAENYATYFYFAYIAAPLALIGVVYLVLRVDWFELVARFWPVYLLMLVETGLITVNLWFGIGVPAENIFGRLGGYFLHLFYYVPVIHYLTRAGAMPSGEFQEGAESHRASVVIRRALHWVFNQASHVYLPLLVVVLSFYAAASVFALRDMDRAEIAPRAPEISGALSMLTSGAAHGSVLVAEEPGVNLMVPVAGRYGSLWASRFTGTLSEAQVVERLALYAQLVGWSEEQFVGFMNDRGISATTPAGFVTGEIPDGVGYWLARGRAALPTADENAFVAQVRAAYRGINPAEAARRLGVARVLSSKPLPAGLVADETHDTPTGRLYIFRP